MSAAAIRCEDLLHIHRVKELEVVALRGVDLDVAPGETLALLGPSGSGKSTLLSILAGLVRPSAGRVEVLGRDVTRMEERERLSLRRRDVGVLLQTPARNLLPYASARENVRFAGGARARADELLEAVGLAGSARKRVRALSGGEQQRLGLAVSLAAGPRLLLADEPTSQLDEANSAQIAALLRDVRDRYETTVVVVTHDPALGAAMDRTVSIRDGRVGAEGRLGRELAVIASDGSLQLPPDALELVPPGSRAQVVRRGDVVELRPEEDA